MSLTKQAKEPKHILNVHFPPALWALIEKYLSWGKVTAFVLDAVREKIQRDFGE